MAQERSQGAPIRLSLLDRLIDHDPDVTREVPSASRQLLRTAIDGVRRDLEDLLNCREAWVADVRGYEFASRSILVYGLSGIETDPDDVNLPDAIRREIEHAIATFEPRLTNVAVIREDSREGERSLRFRIDAMLRLDPVREPVSFDTVLRTNREAEVTAL